MIYFVEFDSIQCQRIFLKIVIKVDPAFHSLNLPYLLHEHTHSDTRVSGNVKLLCNSILSVLRSQFKVLGTTSATLD
jgi:hypothetical protein